MANLFIIGNGFDLAHGLETSYVDFKKWLVEAIQDVDFDKLKQQLFIEVRNASKKQTERMDLLDIAIENLSIEELEQRIISIKQLEMDFIQIDHWANFNAGNFNEIELVSPYTQKLIETVKPMDIPFSREFFVVNYLEFRKIFTEFSDKILGEEYFEQISRTSMWDLSKLELPMRILLLIKLIDETTDGKWWNFEQSLGQLNIDKFVK